MSCCWKLSLNKNSTLNSQTGVVNVASVVWDFGEDFNSAVTTTQGGQINNWIRR